MNFLRFRGRPKQEEVESAEEKYKQNCMKLKHNHYYYENNEAKQDNDTETTSAIDEGNEMGE